MKKFYWTLVITLVGGLALGGNPASAQNVTCTNNINLPAGTYNNVNVPKNSFCIMNQGVTVTGNVTLAAGASLAIDGVTVMGSVLSTDAGIDIADAMVGGNISAIGTITKAPVNGGTEVRVSGSNIVGNIQIVGNAVGIIAVDDDTVTGNVVVQSNSTLVLQGSNIVANNLIGGNLVCIRNTPPTEHGGNTVGGNKVGQCAGL